MDFPGFIDKAIIGLNSASWNCETEKSDLLQDISRLDFVYGEPFVFQAILNCPQTRLTLTFTFCVPVRRPGNR